MVDGAFEGTFPGGTTWKLPTLGVGGTQLDPGLAVVDGHMDELAFYDLSTGGLSGQDIADHFGVIVAGPSEVDLVINGYDPGTGLLSVSVNSLPAGQIFHLRTAVDLQTFVPLAPTFDFDSNTPQPFQIDTGGSSELYLQVFDGPTP